MCIFKPRCQVDPQQCWDTGQFHSWRTVQGDPRTIHWTVGEGQLGPGSGVCRGGCRPVPILLTISFSAWELFYLVWGQESSLCKLTSKSLQNGRSWHLCFLPGTFLNVVGTEHRLLELKEETLRDEMVMNWGFLLYPSQPLAQRPGQSEDNASLSNSLRRQALHPLALSRRHERESSHLARRVSGAEDMATPGKGKWDGAGVPPHPDNHGSAPHPPLSQWCSSADPLYDYAILPTDIKWTLVVTTDKNWNQSKSNLGKLMVLF